MEEGIRMLEDFYVYYVDEGGDVKGETWITNIFDP